MNYFLELYHIHEYFRRVSSMDTERIAATESIGLCHDFALDYIIRNLIMTEIPDYYQNESCDEELSCDVIVNELQKRGHLCRRRHRNGISKVKVDIEGKHFVIGPYYKGGWNLHYVPFNFNTKMKGYELKNMPVESLVDMMEDIAAVPDSINQLYRMYLDMICGDFGPEHIQDAEYFNYDYLGTLVEDDKYYGLLAIAIDGPKQVQYAEEAPSKKRVDAIREGFKKNQMVAELTAQTICQAKLDLYEERLFQANTIEYTCFSSCILLLAPYGRRGALIGTVEYSDLPQIKDILRQIAAFKDGDTLPEGFRLLK